jgi:hypothetical protein
MSRSRYDELHDRFEPILTGKSGTRYERLAAMVWKALHEQNIVVHDVRLMGDSQVSHQIDVKMDLNGARHRTVMECKDFDVGGAKVRLGVVRDFRSVLEDTAADEGIVVTCTGFTRNARKYAKAKSIKLMVLRLFEGADMDGRIQTVRLSVRMRGATDLTVEGRYGRRRCCDFSEAVDSGGLWKRIHALEPRRVRSRQRDYPVQPLSGRSGEQAGKAGAAKHWQLARADRP